jgi:biotin carboxyl carrier protein
MKRYRINVNGKTYDVSVESLGETASVPAVSAAPAAVQPAVQAPAEEPVTEVKEAAPAVSTVVPDGEKIEAPMPGTILEVKVQVGDTVKKGDPVFVLEAMKLENDINAPCDGTVASVNVSKSTVVNVGDVLAVIR